MLIPRQTVPGLTVETLAGDSFDIFASKPQHFTLVVFYRGLHCPVCTKYLRELEPMVPDFQKHGVEVIALSTDDKERAEAMAKKIGAQNLRIGYGVSLPTARQWGLYLSEGRGPTSAGIEEPPLFSEPGVFLVRPDGTLYYGAVQTMPFARPNLADLLAGLDFVIPSNYPARGEYTGPV